MKAAALPIPGIKLGTYPERRVVVHDAVSRALKSLRAFFGTREEVRCYASFVHRVDVVERGFGNLDASAVRQRLTTIRARLAREGFTDESVAEAFVLIKHVCTRELGLELFPTQLMAARIMLDQRLAEMATGEGKTVAAALSAATAALAGVPVHLITSNDYLVARDATSLRPLYAALGLNVASVTQTTDLSARRRAYRCDVVYCTASELAFDYLRDRVLHRESRNELHRRVLALDRAPSNNDALLRGLCMAIVDEADSVLIDEARIPLILSERGSRDGHRRCLDDAVALAGRLREASDFALHQQTMSAHLTERGREALEQLTQGLDAAWHNRMHRDEIVCTALAALHLYERDRHYLIRDGKIEIVDETTGRIAQGRRWSRSLHELLEIKERCEVTDHAVTLAQITYQRFFQRYHALAGMSGTLSEARAELLSTYGLPIVRVPLARPSRRTVLPTQLYADDESLWKGVIKEALEVSRTGRPVLVGTDSVVESEALSRRFLDAGVAHAVLNARQDENEAHLISQAGRRGQITIATNMAGRGTDIELATEIAELGGLHLICCQHNASRRIDRQLLGRCARRGDPGTARTMLALSKPLVARLLPRWVAGVLGRHTRERPRWLITLLIRGPQLIEERRQRGQRRELLRQDRRIEQRGAVGMPL